MSKLNKNVFKYLRNNYGNFRTFALLIKYDINVTSEI